MKNRPRFAGRVAMVAMFTMSAMAWAGSGMYSRKMVVTSPKKTNPLLERVPLTNSEFAKRVLNQVVRVEFADGKVTHGEVTKILNDGVVIRIQARETNKTASEQKYHARDIKSLEEDLEIGFDWTED